MSHKDTVTQEQTWKISIQDGVSYVTETRTAEIFTKRTQHRDINVTQRYSHTGTNMEDSYQTDHPTLLKHVQQKFTVADQRNVSQI